MRPNKAPAALQLALELRSKRDRLGLTQKQAADLSGIPYGTYVQAETYARMGSKVQLAVHRWIHKQEGLGNERRTAHTRR